MTDSDKRRFTRLEMADYLENLARQLKARTFQVAGERYIVPEALEGKVELRAKMGRVSLKLRFKWPKPPEAEAAAAPPPVARLEPAAPAPTVGLPAAATAQSFKEIKHRMGSLFAELLKAAGQGTLPPLEGVEAFLELCRASSHLAEPDWETEMQEFMDHAENLLRIRREGSLEMFAHELRDLQTRMKACHQEYK